MRIFFAFLIILCSAIFWLLPVTENAYAFQTDKREDTFTVVTAAAVTTGNVTLQKVLYDDDVSTIEVISDTSDDIPLYSSYNTTTRLLAFTGLAANTTRTLTVDYDIQAPGTDGAIGTVIDKFGGPIYLIIIISFPLAGLASLFFMR